MYEKKNKNEHEEANDDCKGSESLENRGVRLFKAPLLKFGKISVLGEKCLGK